MCDEHKKDIEDLTPEQIRQLFGDKAPPLRGAPITRSSAVITAEQFPLWQPVRGGVVQIVSIKQRRRKARRENYSMGTPQDPPYPFLPPPFPVPDPDAPPDPDEDQPPPAPLPALAVHPSAGANKRSSDPPPASEPWLDRPLTAEELKAARIRLSRLTDTELVKAYDAALEMCRLDRGVPPRAAFIQQLVASWKELQRRQKAK